MFKEPKDNIIDYKKVAMRRKERAVMSAITSDDILFGEKSVDYLTEGMADLDKPMSDDEFDEYLKFYNDDLYLSDVLDSVPEFTCDMPCYEDLFE